MRRGRPPAGKYTRYCRKCDKLFPTTSKYCHICPDCGGGKTGGTSKGTSRHTRNQTSMPYWKRLILYGTTEREAIDTGYIEG